MQVWRDNNFKHEYLTFTHKHNESEIVFLDLSIHKNINNILSTNWYSKLTHKHKFLH